MIRHPTEPKIRSLRSYGWFQAMPDGSLEITLEDDSIVRFPPLDFEYVAEMFGKRKILRKCPFCGDPADVNSNDVKTLFSVGCSRDTCGARVIAPTHELGVQMWNRRFA